MAKNDNTRGVFEQFANNRKKTSVRKSFWHLALRG